MLEKIVPLVFVGETVLFKSKYLINVVTLAGNQTVSERVFGIDLQRLIVIFKIHHSLSTVDDEDVFLKVLLDFSL